MSSDLDIEKSTEIQEASTSLFYEDPNVLKLIMDTSVDGKRGPLIPVVHVKIPVQSVVIPIPKVKERPSAWVKFNVWWKNTNFVNSLSRNNPKLNSKQRSSYDIPSADNEKL